MPQIKCTECNEHSGLDERVKRDEEDIQRLWKAIDVIRGWVVAGMGSMVVYFLVIAGDKVFEAVHK